MTKDSVHMISAVVARNACTGCGTCVVLCPAHAIAMDLNAAGEYLPTVDPQKCTRCHLCLAVCPEVTPSDRENAFTVSSRYSASGRAVDGQDAAPGALGQYRACFVGHASDGEVRYRAASGGIITTLLLYGLRHGHYDAVTAIRPSESGGMMPQPCLTGDEKEIMAASGSWYCPVPLNRVIADILDFDGRVAVVGLPCHIRGFRQAAKRLPVLEKRIACYLGLVCHHGVTLRGAQLLARRSGLASGQWTGAPHRGHGWPGMLQILDAEGRPHRYPYKEAWATCLNYFWPLACLACQDGVSAFADIALGDAWLPEMRGSYATNPGENLIIVRTKRGHNLLQEAQRRESLALSSIDRRSAVFSLHAPLERQRRARARLGALRAFGYPTPEFSDMPTSPVGHRLGAFLCVATVLAVRRPFVFALLAHAPAFLLRLLGVLYTVSQEGFGHVLAGVVGTLRQGIFSGEGKT
ncbi:MAG: Coenzyme F420 hydrogenase/dehydrogenase, beta subunit C-terminal domain [Anaerolineae bacterium]